jgi:hypothetical protein
MLWKMFSQFIRLRDADENGICRCFTCGRVRHWKKLDAGHGIPRQHKATKYDEKNNNAQCKDCNGFEGGMREVYKIKLDAKYGAGTWDKLEVLSRTTCKRGPFEIEVLYNHYREKVNQLKKEKNIV